MGNFSIILIISHGYFWPLRGFKIFIADHHAHFSQEEHLAHLRGCGCEGNYIFNDFLFLMTFLALLEAKLDFIERCTSSTTTTLQVCQLSLLTGTGRVVSCEVSRRNKVARKGVTDKKKYIYIIKKKIYIYNFTVRMVCPIMKQCIFCGHCVKQVIAPFFVNY